MKPVNNKQRIEPHHLPERLKSQFRELKSRLWRVELALSINWGVFAVLLSFLSAFVLDRWHDTPSLIRGSLLLGALVAACLSGGWWCWRWMIAERNLRDYSRLVQRQYRILGDRLLGIVELTEDNSEETTYSEELYQAAVQQVDLDARGCDFTQAVPTTLLKRLCIISGTLALIAVILLGILPGAFKNTLTRWIKPGSPRPRYTLVTIQPDTQEHLTIRGESFQLGADVKYLSFWKPSKVTVQLDSGYQVTGEVEGERIQLEIPGQFKETNMKVLVGDGSAESQIKPMQRPTLVSLSATIKMPEYLELPDDSLQIESGGLDILKGSKIQITGAINRDLKELNLTWGSLNPVQVTISNATFTSEWLETGDAFEASLQWTDTYGFTNAQPWNLNIRQREDQAPTFQFPELYREMAILETEALELKTEVRDDYGVKDFGINWETLNGVKPSKEVLEFDFSDSSLHSAQKELGVSFYFSPNLYNIEPGDVVEMRGFVTDFYPDRVPGQTAIYRIHIVSAVEHAERIRQQLEALLTQLEDVSRLEQSIATATNETIEQMDTLSEEELTARLEDQAMDQKLNASQLSEMARKGMETLKEAMRNPSFTDEVMSEWSKTLSEMQQLAEQKMQEAAESLSKASQSSPSQSQSSKSAQQQAMQEAQETEQEILESLEALQAMVNEDLDQLQALTLAQRLRGLGKIEMDLETTLMDGAEDTIGLFPDELAPRWRALHDKLGDTQKETADKSQELQDEIGRFFERTQKEAYGEVSEDMKARQIVEGIITTQELILKNITMEAADQVSIWATQFEKWASQLEPQKESDGSGGGEGGGESNQEDLTKQLMALLRMRESELNLRMQTRLLDRQNSEPEIRVEKGRALSDDQSRLQEDLLQVREETPIPFLDQIFEEIHSHMGNAADALARGQTDDRAIEPETKSITALTDAINILNEQAQQNSSSSSSSSQAMSFMMQMMMAKQGMGQQGKGNMGGGSTAGGDTDRNSLNPGGNDEGDAGESRSVSRGSGQAGDLPTEFRKSFEAYYKQLEQLEQPSPVNNPSN